MLSLLATPFIRSSALAGLLGIAAWLALTPAATAAEEYRIGVERVDYFPIYSVSAEGQYQGYARDLLDLFAAHAQVRLHYVPLPVRRLYHEYWAGRLDLVFPDNPRWNQGNVAERGVSYSKPVLTFQDVMLVVPDRLGQPPESFRKLGFISGFTPWKFQREIDAGRVEIHQAPNPEGLIRMALAGYIDAANMAQQVAHYHLARLGQPDVLVVEPGLLAVSDSHYHLSSIRHPELIERFDAFLASEHQAVTALKHKYGL